MNKITETVGADNTSTRIDVFTSEIADITRSRAAALIADGCVTVNGRKAAKSDKVKAGDTVTVTVPEPAVYDITPENIPLDIDYEDSELLEVNQPKGMVGHPAAGKYSGTRVSALLIHCGSAVSGINGVRGTGIVNRIDKNTSGLLIVAKNDLAHTSLAEQIKAHSFTREYHAVVYGGFQADSGTVDAPIGRHPVKRKQMAVVEGGRNAVTHYSVAERFEGFTHLSLRLETGRTHQIRVHMAYIGHPVAGDDVYGPKKVITELCGQCLHAGKIGFIHPRTNEYMEFTSPLPEYFTRFLNKLNPL